MVMFYLIVCCIERHVIIPKEKSPADFNSTRRVLLGVYDSPMTLTKVVCTVNLSEPVEIMSSDHPYDHKY